MNARVLVSPAELAERLRGGDALAVDCRFDLADPERGEREHHSARVPGAGYLHLDRDLSDLAKRGMGRHPLPHDLVFSEALARAGWRPGIDVVFYDDAGGALAAARAWWLLRLAGHRGAVLDGGWTAWRTEGRAVESGESRHVEGDVHVSIDRSQVVWFDELERRRAVGALVLVDARAAPRFRGDVEPLDRVAGHVPGARNRPFSDNLLDGRFRDAGTLRTAFADLIAPHAPKDVVHMCGSGVTACHNLLAMEHAGLVGSRVFAPSWSGWLADATRPVATGE
jgi:thiosulfate/3-mercaptopyruvate sulfurtransferase